MFMTITQGTQGFLQVATLQTHHALQRSSPEAGHAVSSAARGVAGGGNGLRMSWANLEMVIELDWTNWNGD